MLARAEKRAFLTGEGLELGGEVFDVPGVGRLVLDLLDGGEEVVPDLGFREFGSTRSANRRSLPS